MATKKKLATGRQDRASAPGVRVSIYVAQDALTALAEWDPVRRPDDAGTASQARHLIEQAVLARGDRLALTRLSDL